MSKLVVATHNFFNFEFTHDGKLQWYGSDMYGGDIKLREVLMHRFTLFPLMIPFISPENNKLHMRVAGNLIFAQKNFNSDFLANFHPIRCITSKCIDTKVDTISFQSVYNKPSSKWKHKEKGEQKPEDLLIENDIKKEPTDYEDMDTSDTKSTQYDDLLIKNEDVSRPKVDEQNHFDFEPEDYWEEPIINTKTEY